jgi:ornithine carbamoyltransferase
MKKDFIALSDFLKSELLEILDLAKDLKKNPIQKTFEHKNLAMIFEKSSTRTRVSFEVGANQLGGDSLFIDSRNSQLGKGETITDTAKVLSRFVDMIIIRAISHADVLELAENSTVPVINGLTDFNHPCQIMADILTIIEKFGSIEDKVICWIGDGNNMLNSWLNAAIIFGFKIQAALHKNYMPDEKLLNQAIEAGVLEVFNNSKDAAQNADAINTDTFVSMGDVDEAQRKKDFKGFIVTEDVMMQAKPNAIFMHCLPAYRGEEVESTVIDGNQSVVFEQAENRLHAQKAIMCYLLK